MLTEKDIDYDMSGYNSSDFNNTFDCLAFFMVDINYNFNNFCIIINFINY